MYPDAVDPNKQLFEFLLMVRLDDALGLASIHRFSWKYFVQLCRWDKRMSDWYLSCSTRTTCAAEIMFPRAAQSPRGS